MVVRTYRISQLAERSGLKPTALRFYEREGLLPARRSPAGYRLYDEESIERLSFISSGKHLGLPLEEIRDLLRVWEDGQCSDVRERLRPMLLGRIAQVEQRTAELAAFTGRLRTALAEIDGPARSGRCDPACGFLRRKQQPAAVPVGFSPRRPEPVPASGAASESVPMACTLGDGDQADRIGQWQRLLAGADAEPIERGRRFHLTIELVGQVAELAAAEQRCCPFFEFTLQLQGAGLWFEVCAPAAAAPLLARVFGTTG